jgi:tRNA dimethylallyltransferase
MHKGGSALKTKLITVAGATASGKTALSIALAKEFQGEIISCDSMQVYVGMDIGTAKPDESEKSGIIHHMIDVCQPNTDFSCADFRDMASKAADDITSRGHVPILCGGTGLYIDALTDISALSAAPSDENVRSRLMREYETSGGEELHRRLEAVDPESAKKIHPNNVRRVMRALEIYELTGTTKTQWDRRSREAEPPYDNTMLILDFLDRELLYRRIDRRVDIMMKAGLEGEVRRLYDSGLFDIDCTAAQAIGYKEFLPYFRGEATVDEVTDKIKQYSRNYAKRQITWFAKYKNALRIHPDAPNGYMRSAEDIAAEAAALLRERGFR